MNQANKTLTQSYRDVVDTEEDKKTFLDSEGIKET